MALGLELPKKVFGHPWLLSERIRCQNPKGNVIYADDLRETFSALTPSDIICSPRCLMPLTVRLPYTTIIERYNSELANTLGNLVNRTDCNVK